MLAFYQLQKYYLCKKSPTKRKGKFFKFLVGWGNNFWKWVRITGLSIVSGSIGGNCLLFALF